MVPYVPLSTPTPTMTASDWPNALLAHATTSAFTAPSDDPPPMMAPGLPSFLQEHGTMSAFAAPRAANRIE